MRAVGGAIFSVLTLIGVALVMNINNSIALGALTLRARNPREGFWIRLGGLLTSLVVRLVLVMVMAASLRPEFEGLLGLHVNRTVQRVLCLIAGGFLLVNGGVEMKGRLRVPDLTDPSGNRRGRTLGIATGIVLVAAVDISLSFDSLIAVAGMAAHPAIMPAIVVVEVVAILFFAETVARILRRYPTIETLAICALVLMGSVMMLRAVGYEVPDAVVYAMIGFALLVELLDMRIAAVAGTGRGLSAEGGSARKNR